jgi:pimeloyl-ACP methyl ester carboxylesterase
MHGASIAIDAELTWRQTIDRLSRSHRVVAFDQPGFGRTDMPKSGRYMNRLERVPHALALLDRLGIQRACLVGHSEGAFMATRMAIERPMLASGLVLVTTGGTAPRLGGELDRDWIAASKAAYDYSGGADTEEGFIRANALLTRVPDPLLEQKLRQNYRRAAAAGQIAMFRDLPADERDLDRYLRLQETQIHPYLAAVAAPTLIVWAALDPTVPVERGVALMRCFPRADLHVFGGASHMVMLDRADDFNCLLASWCAGRH